MGLFDRIEVYMKCPYCGEVKTFEAQTKDLGNLMYHYSALPKDWKTSVLRRKFRSGLPLFRRFPEDITAHAWSTQAEKREAEATVHEDYKKIKSVSVVVTCESIQCRFDADRRDMLMQRSPSGFGRMFHGRIRIKDCRLVGEVYDIKKDDLTERKLSKWKDKLDEKNKKVYNKLLKIYKHDPIVLRNWNKHWIRETLNARRTKKK